MKNFGAKWLALAMVVGVGASTSLNGCGDGPTPSPIAGASGGAGRGGTTGTAGSTAGTGGSTAGRGGTTGSAGRGGTTGTAGTGGAGGGLLCPHGTFDTNTMEGFGLNTFMGTSAGSATNLAADRDGAPKATLAWDGTDGDPAVGSLKVEAPYSDYNQFVDVQRVFGDTMLKNWSGLRLHVKAKVSGGNPSAMNPMGVQPYVNTGATFGGYCGNYVNLISGGGWNDYTLDLATCAAASSDPSMVIAFGVSFQAGSGSDSDGGVNSMKPAAATIHVDSFWLERSATCMGGGTGGTGGGTAGTGGAAGGATGTGGAVGGATGTGGAVGGATGTGGATAGTGGGAAGTGGGAGGTGGAALTTLFDFEAGVQGWMTSTPTTVAASTEQKFDGLQSLKITYGALDNANIIATVNSPAPALWPGTVLTFHAYLPAGFDTSGAHYFQAVGQANNYAIFDTAGNGTRTATAGAWNTWTYTVPNTFPGGFQALGFQLGDNSGGATIAAGSVYVDAITATGGTQNCAVAIGTGAHTFEMSDAGTLDTNVYKKDGNDTDTAASQSTDQKNGGAASWKVAFTALPAPASGSTTSRRVYIAGPNIYCGQVATVHVYLPAGSDGLTFQVFAQYNNYAKNSFTGPATVTRGAWNTYAFTVPSDVGPGGIQQLGVQLIWAGTTAFTGNVYIDDVTW